MTNTSTSTTSDDLAVIRSHVQRVDRRLSAAQESMAAGEHGEASALMVDARENLQMLSDTLGGLCARLQAAELLDAAVRPGSGLHLARLLNMGGI